MTVMADDETAVCQDEGGLQLNPNVGSCWMPRGDQAKVPMRDSNGKRKLAGLLV